MGRPHSYAQRVRAEPGEKRAASRELAPASRRWRQVAKLYKSRKNQSMGLFCTPTNSFTYVFLKYAVAPMEPRLHPIARLRTAPYAASSLGQGWKESVMVFLGSGFVSSPNTSGSQFDNCRDRKTISLSQPISSLPLLTRAADWSPPLQTEEQISAGYRNRAPAQQEISDVRASWMRCENPKDWAS